MDDLFKLNHGAHVWLQQRTPLCYLINGREVTLKSLSVPSYWQALVSEAGEQMQAGPHGPSKQDGDLAKLRSQFDSKKRV